MIAKDNFAGLDDDPLEEVLNAPLEQSPRQAPEHYKPLHEQTCPKCRGSGRFVSYSGRVLGQCFACKGAGKQTFKTSPEQRAKNRAASHTRKANDLEAKVEAFKAAEPEAYAWLLAKVETFEFATKMWHALRHWGSLTDGQLAAVKRCIEQDKQRDAARAEREANAPVADTAGVDRLKEAFDKAIAFTAAKVTDTGMPLRLRSPRITIGGITISPAKADGKNPGALYVKSGSTYLGKIANGRLVASRECTEEQQAKVLAFLADPKAAAEAYGKETGICCVCNATLTSKWRLRGIGPVCAQKFGF